MEQPEEKQSMVEPSDPHFQIKRAIEQAEAYVKDAPEGSDEKALWEARLRNRRKELEIRIGEQARRVDKLVEGK